MGGTQPILPRDKARKRERKGRGALAKENRNKKRGRVIAMAGVRIGEQWCGVGLRGRAERAEGGPYAALELWSNLPEATDANRKIKLLSRRWGVCGERRGG